MSGILETLIEALNANTAAILGNAGAATTAATKSEATSTTAATKGTKGTKTTKPEVASPKHTVEEVQAAAVAVKDKFGSPAATELIKEHGKAEKLKDIKPENYDAFVEACEAKVAEEAEAEDDL